MAKIENLVIMESPEKAKKLNDFFKELNLSGKWFAIASRGHVRELANTGPRNIGIIDPNTMLAEWEINPAHKKVVSEILAKAKEANRVVLTTDPDREGEAIAWHLAELIRPINKNICRMELKEITKEELTKEMSNLHQIDMNLVSAALARAIIDKTLGYTLSPEVQEAVEGAKSAGRVQSVVLKLICQNEKTRKEFKEIVAYTPYTTINEIDFKEYNSQKINEKIKLVEHKILDQAKAIDYVQKLNKENHSGTISKISKKQAQENPYTPYSTDAMLIDASKKLKYQASVTTMLAQRLYEAGFITYIRTDSTRVSDETAQQVYKWITDNKGAEAVGKLETTETAKEKKNSQDGHPAITPTKIGVSANEVRAEFKNDEVKDADRLANLYSMIWGNTVNAGIRPATVEKIKYVLSLNDVDSSIYIANEKKYLDFGVFELGINTPTKQNPNHPIIEAQDEFAPIEIRLKKSTTKPPKAFNEATMIAKLKDLGIGRPSTYASSVQVNVERGFVEINKKGEMVSTPIGRDTNAFLQKKHSDFINTDYTKELEDQLDAIAQGKISYVAIAKNVWDKMFDIQIPEHIKQSPQMDMNCPKCKKHTIFKLTSKSGVTGLVCRNKNCNWSDWTYFNATCPKCHINKLIYFFGKKDGKAYEMCPDKENCGYFAERRKENLAGDK